jgi:SSS family solute:Na+ symporter
VYLTRLDAVIIAAYFAGLVCLGVYYSKKHKSQDTYFLGGRQMPWFFVGISLIASMLSTVSYLATPGEMIRYGVKYFTGVLGYVFVIPVVNRILIPFLMRLPVTSVYEYIEKRFNVTVRSMAAAIFMAGRLIWISTVIYTAALAVSATTGYDKAHVIIVIGVVTIFYTSAGGLPAVIWSDCAQFVILFGGAILIPFYVGFHTHSGPREWWAVFSQAGRAHVPIFSLDLTERITLIGMLLDFFFWSICIHGADQMAAQRYLSTPSVSSARRSVWVFAVCDIVMAFLLMTSGLCVFYYYYVNSHLPVSVFQASIFPDADKALPRFIARDLPAGVSGFILAGLLAAAMSALSSGINAIASVASTDIAERLGFTKKTGGLKLPIILSVCTGSLGIILALAVNRIMERGEWNLVDLMQRSGNVFVAPLGALFFIGILFRRVGSKAALVGFCVGVSASVLISFNKELLGLQHAISWIWILPFSFSVTMGVSYAAGYLFSGPSDSQLKAMHHSFRKSVE